MKRFRLAKIREGIQAEKQTLLELAVLLAGIGAIILAVRSLPGVSFPAGVVFTGAVLICGVMYGLFTARGKWLLKGSALLLAVCGTAGIARWDLFTAQLSALAGSLVDPTVQGETNVTYALLLMVDVLSVCFFVLELVWKQHWLPYAAVTVIMVSAPLLGIEAGIAPVILGLVFQILFWTMHTAGGRMKNRRSTEEKRISLPFRCSAFMGAVLCVLVCISVIITAVWGSGLSDLVYSGEGFVSRSLQRITGRAEEPAASRYVSGGNNYRTGETQIEVILQDQPEETLYLKGFTGGEYTGGEWEDANERDIFGRIAAALHWEEWESWIAGMYNSMYFTMNEASAENASCLSGMKANPTKRCTRPITAPGLTRERQWGRGMRTGIMKKARSISTGRKCRIILRGSGTGTGRSWMCICRRSRKRIPAFRKNGCRG